MLDKLPKRLNDQTSETLANGHADVIRYRVVGKNPFDYLVDTSMRLGECE